MSNYNIVVHTMDMGALDAVKTMARDFEGSYLCEETKPGRLILECKCGEGGPPTDMFSIVYELEKIGFSCLPGMLSFVKK